MHIMRLVLPLAVGLIVALASLASAQQRVAQGATAPALMLLGGSTVYASHGVMCVHEPCWFIAGRFVGTGKWDRLVGPFETLAGCEAYLQNGFSPDPGTKAKYGEFACKPYIVK